MHFSIDRTVHTTAFDKPVVDHWLERKITQTAAGSTEKDRSDDRPLQRRARYRLSYIPLLFSVYPDFNNIANFGNSYPVILMESVKNSFWKDCLDAFRYFAHNIHSSSFDELLTEPIFYNPYNLIDKKPFYNAKWYQKGISQITDVFNKNGKILTLKDIQDNFDIELSFVSYYGIVRSIRKYFSSLKIVQPDTFSLLDDTNVMRNLFAIKHNTIIY